LMGSTSSPKMKRMEGKGVGAHSLARNISGGERGVMEPQDGD
jgi:hypothetical protein